MFKPISPADIRQFRDGEKVKSLAEYVRFPHLFNVPINKGHRPTVIIIGAAGKKLPKNITDILGDTKPDQTDSKFTKQYGFGLGMMTALHMAPNWNIVGTYSGSADPARELELVLRAYFESNSELVQLDVTDVNSVKPFVDEVFKKYGEVSAIVYAPSVIKQRREHLVGTPIDEYEYAARGNWLSYVALMNEILPRVAGQKPDIHGIKLRVAYLGSISGDGTPSPGRAAYCDTKAAGMTHTLQVSADHSPEVMAFNFNVSIADTAATVNVRDKYRIIMKDQSHLGRMFTSEELARDLVTQLTQVHHNHGAQIQRYGAFRQQTL